MAGKDDAVKDLCAVGQGRAPAEKMAVEEELKAEKMVGGEEEFKAEEVAAFVPQPLPRTLGSKHKREKSYLLSNLTLRSCSGGRTPTEEEKADCVYAGGHTPMEKAANKADSVSGVLRPCTGSHTLAEEKAVEPVALSSEKSDVDASFSLYQWGKTNGAADASSLEAGAVEGLEASAVDREEDSDSDIKWVEMPMAHIRWILSQKKENHVVPPIDDYDLYNEEAMKSTVFSQKNIDEQRKLFTTLHASLQAKHDDFFEFQAWVREIFEKNGRVLVPESCSKEELQEEINDLWAQFKEEYARDHPDGSDTETEEEDAFDTDCNA